MSAVSLRRKLSYRVYVYVRSLARFEHTSSASREIDADTVNNDGEPKIPLVPKRRDPNAVLKALQSTVGPVKHHMLVDGRSMADPLAPFNGRLQHMEYVRMREAGKTAARYIINKWPTMFPHTKLSKDVEFEKSSDVASEERLRWLVSERRTEDSLKMYNELKEKSVVVSLEVLNNLLALLAYEGTGNKKANEYDPSQMVINWPPKGPLSPSTRGRRKEVTDEAEQEALKAMESLQEELQPARDVKRYTSSKSTSSGDVKSEDVLVWSAESAAEKLFAEMETKDGETYDAMIQGLMKHRNYSRAFDLFTEIRKQKMQASLRTYNQLLGALLETDDSAKLFPRSKLLASEMNSEPVVQPDITTMNHLLDVSLATKSAKRTMASGIMREIIHLGLEPTLTTFNRLLKAFTQTGEGQVLYEIVDYLEQHPQVLQPHSEQDLYFFLEASYTARLLGDAALATRLKQLASRDHYFLVNNLNFFLSHYLVTIAAHGDIEQLKQECKDLIPNTLLPYEWVYGLMFRACEEAQSPEFGLQLWKDMSKYRVPIFNTETLERFCGAISSRIHPPDAPQYITALEKAWREIEQKNMRPPVYLISQSVRMNVLNNDLEGAWHYYDYFKKYQYPPTFLALTVLLKAHYAVGDKEKMVEIMDTMIERKNVLPLFFIKKLCFSTNIDKATRSRLVRGFSENMRNKDKQRTQRKWASPSPPPADDDGAVD